MWVQLVTPNIYLQSVSPDSYMWVQLVASRNYIQSVNPDRNRTLKLRQTGTLGLSGINYFIYVLMKVHYIVTTCTCLQSIPQ